VGLVGYVVALVMLVLPLVTRPIGALFPLWVLIVSVEMLIHRGRIAGGRERATSLESRTASGPPTEPDFHASPHR